MRTAKELSAFHGKQGLVRFDLHLQVGVRIMDSKVSYGNERFQVEPLAGRGSLWIDASRVSDIADCIHVRTELQPAIAEGNPVQCCLDCGTELGGTHA